MAVTDLTDSLPWWARQGAGPTGGPGAAPQGSGVGGQPPPGVNQQAWLQYLMQMFSPNSASAAEAPTTNGGPSPDDLDALKHPSPVSAALGGGGPPVPPDVTGSSVTMAPPANPPARPAGVSASGLPLQPGSLSPGALAQFASAAGGPSGSGGYVPWPSGGGGMNQTAPPPPGQQAPGAPVPGPLAGGGASAQGATSNPRFVQVDRPNANPIGRGGGPQMTALNLAGLFGGAQPAANLPSPNAQPVSANRRVPGPLAAGGGMVPSTYPGDNWDIDAQGNVVPNYGSAPSTARLQRPPKSSVARARILAPDYYG